MHNVEPYRIETTPERLADALGFAKTSLLRNPHVEGWSKDKAQNLDAGIKSHANEMKAIYYTLRLRGIEETDFSLHVGELSADDIFIAVETSTTNADEVITYTIGNKQEDAPAV